MSLSISEIIVNCLRKIIDEKKDSTIAKEREKAADDERILRNLFFNFLVFLISTKYLERLSTIVKW